MLVGCTLGVMASERAIMGAASPQTRTLELLRRASIRVVEGDLRRLVLQLPNHRIITVTPVFGTRSPHRGSLAAAAASAAPDRVLYLLPTAGPALRNAAADGLVDVVTTSPEQVIIEGQNRLEAAPHSTGDARTRRARWGRWAVDRVLILSSAPLPQAELAAASGITQQGVSKILRSHPAVTSVAAGWQTGSPAALLDAWAQDYPGPGGIDAGWYHLDPVTTQIGHALEVATDLGVTALATGDAAADTYAPWRLPPSGMVCISEAIDLTVAGFVAADTAEATLTTRVPRDHTIWPVARWYAARSHEYGGGRLADPVAVYWDLLHARGPDAADAAGVLRKRIVNGDLRV